MINFNQLRTFYHAAKCLNFTRAAADLFVSQPAVTAQMKAMEDFCGFSLFKKKSRTNVLTEEGRILFQYAKTVFGVEKEIEGAIDDMRQLKRGLLRIGTTKAYARYFMPLMLTSFHNKYPNIKIELHEGNSLEMTYSLLDFKNEVVIIAKAEDIKGIRFIPFSQEEMVVIAAPSHPLARKEAIFFRQLAPEPFIMKDKGSGTRKLVDQLFARNHATPDILMEVSNAEFIKQLVQRGDGVSFLVREAVAAELADGRLAEVALRGKTVYLDVSIAYLENQQLSPAAKAFLSTLEDLQFGREMTPQGIGAYMARILARQKSDQQKGTRG